VLYGKTQEQLIEWESVSDAVSKPSASRGKPEVSVETPEVEKRADVYHRSIAGSHKEVTERFRQPLKSEVGGLGALYLFVFYVGY
jgi:hypothetical protein